jgi:ADP-L-glycero-D-manno-heptose 6-epimerase
MTDNGIHIVTGGAGFIGSAFISKLNSKSIDRIIVVDELESSSKWKNLLGKSFLDYLHKDQFRAALSSGKFANQIRSITHMGACSSTTETNVEYLMQNNFRYSCEIADYALKHNIRFIYASSAATYGDGASGYSDQDFHSKVLRPLNPYGFSKYLFDLWAINSGAVSKMVGLKFFNVYGPNEYHKGSQRSVIHQAYLQAKTTGRIRLFKSYRPEFRDGEQKRDFIYIKDCTEIMWNLLTKPEVVGIYNLGTGTARTWNEVARAVFDALKMQGQIEYIEMPEALRNQYQYFTQADVQKLQLALPETTFSDLKSSISDYILGYLEKSEACI